MKVFLAALIIVGAGVLMLGVNIFFRKDGQFPQFDVGSNDKMKALGIKCMREWDEELHTSGAAPGKDLSCDGNYSEACKGCSLFKSV